MWFAGCIMCFLLLASCEDFLDKQEDEALTFEKIWKTKETTKQYWLNSMSFLPNDTDDFSFSPWIGASDEGSVSYNRETRWINFGSWNASSVPYQKMDFYYRGIRECNIFLQNADICLTNDPTLEKDELEMWKAQSRFARAYYYFLMMRVYGPIFLLGDELLDFTASTEALQRQRNSWDECVNYVVEELESLINNPIVKDGWEGDTDKGLATKGACQALIARLKLYSARDLFNGCSLYANMKNPDGTNLFPVTPDPNKWLEAATAAKVLIDNPKYKLYRNGDGSDPYANYYGITQEVWNSEIIWTTGYKGRYNTSVHTVPTGVSGTAYGGVGPTQQQVDAYAMSNGHYPITGYEGDGTPIIDEKSGYPANELAKSRWTYPAWGGDKDSYELEAPNMYKDREPRFYVSVFFSDDYWKHGTARTKCAFGQGCNSNTSHDHPLAGYLVNRFYDHTSNSSSSTWGNSTFPTFRLAEMYLNFIEATLECKKRGISLPSGYEAKAMEVWDDLRDRSGLDGIKTVYPQADTEKLIELCRRERRIELAFENHRYFDTRTWMIAEQVDGGPMYGMNTFAAGSGDTAPQDYWKRIVFENRVFKSNHYLYPFSQRELDRNRLLVQNYGW